MHNHEFQLMIGMTSWALRTAGPLLLLSLGWVLKFLPQTNLSFSYNCEKIYKYILPGIYTHFQIPFDCWQSSHVHRVDQNCSNAPAHSLLLKSFRNGYLLIHPHHQPHWIHIHDNHTSQRGLPNDAIAEKDMACESFDMILKMKCHGTVCLFMSKWVSKCIMLEIIQHDGLEHLFLLFNKSFVNAVEMTIFMSVCPVLQYSHMNV